MKSNPSVFRFLFSRLAPLLVLLFSGALAMAQADPPARVANLSRIEGSVVFAPAGETEWANAELNRPITRGDRVWTDPGARAELHLGSSALHLDSQTFVDVTNVDSLAFQASLNEGTANARVRELQAGENFEIDTPQLAFRAAQPGDFRIDVDAKSGTTRVIVHSGAAQIFGAGGESLQMQAGEQLAFTGRDLEQVTLQVLPSDNGFDRWVADLNRREDQSVTARYVPRDVVGYQQLDSYGTWAEDPTYGAVWYPTVAVADWAPYRYGHWDFIAPWGWTWIENEPWGFAPFHYGRWATIGSRWCWVPGRLGPRPVYSPALVAFVGGGSGVNFSLSIGGGSGIAWFPLAPGEAWRPYYHASDRYVRNINRSLVVNNTTNNFYAYQRRPDAITAVKMDDFSRGRPVHEHWSRVNPAEVARAPATTMPALPAPGRQHFAEGRGRVQPQGNVPPITASRTQPQFAAPGIERRAPAFERGAPPVVQRGEANEARPQGRPRPDFRGAAPAATAPGQAAQPLFQAPGQQRREEQRALQEQRREQQGRPAPQFEQERAQRAQEEQQRRAQMQQERVQRGEQVQQQQRVQEEQQRRQQIQQERVQRDQQMQRQREAQERQQQSMQERMQRQQAMQQQLQERAQRQQAVQQQQQAAQERMQRQQAMQQQAQERAQRQQQAVQQQQAMRQQAMQERAQQQAAMQQQRAAAMQQRQAQQQPAPRGEARGGRGEERGRGDDRRQQAHDRRDESRS
jgi:hypothetical protein